jgi:hypothetical protein
LRPDAGHSKELTFANSPAGDAFNGLGGIDTITYSGLHTAYTVKHEGGQFTLTDNTTKAVDTLSGIERLNFTDASIAIDVEGNAGQSFGLYLPLA